ncbi:hypothetical protein ACFQY0_19885 [Haloferula chungangensis]|uniref:DUF6242 domain-containing protein n=1 Tax=Haloferula chungangensis TaxID=1048331 RepID=A0ABW2LAI4_9BACT
MTFHRSLSHFIAVIGFGLIAVGVGSLRAESRVTRGGNPPLPIAKAEAGRFPSVQITRVFEPDGESNVRASFRLAEGKALIGTEETGDLFKSVDSGVRWTKAVDGGDEWGIQDIRNIIRARDHHLYATTSEPALVLRSTDEGESWEVMCKPKSSRTVGIIQLDDGAILVGLRRSENDKTSIIRSDDGFKSFDWIPVSEEKKQQNTTCFHSLGGSSVLSGVGYEGSGKIYKSVDSGRTWKKTGEFEEARDVMAFYQEGSRIYVLTSGIGTLFVSEDEGESWAKSRQFWKQGFIGSTATFAWHGKSYRVIPATDQTETVPRHVVLISDDLGKSWFEWVWLVVDLDEKQGGGASNCAVISKDTIIVGVGNHAVQGRCYTLKFR